MFDLPTFPMTMWNPEYGARTVDTVEEATATFTPAHNWFKTPEEADAHRTEAEAARVLHHSKRMTIDGRPLEETGRVMMSNQHEINILQPMREAAELAKNPPEPTEVTMKQAEYAQHPDPAAGTHSEASA